MECPYVRVANPKSALRTGRALLLRNIILLLSKSKGLGKSKNSMTLLGLELATFRLVA
jgi:hypothetical protein